MSLYFSFFINDEKRNRQYLLIIVVVEFAIKSVQLVMLNHYCCRLVNDHILLQGSMTSSIPDMKKVNGLIDLSNKYQEDGANKIDAKVLIKFSTRCRGHFSMTSDHLKHTTL